MAIYIFPIFAIFCVEVLNSLIMKITAEAKDENDIFIDVSVTAAASISTLATY